MYHQFALNREDFMRRYHKRSNVETAFSMIKGKFGDSVLSKSEVGQGNEVLCKVLALNLVVVGQAIHEFGVDPAAFLRPAMEPDLLGFGTFRNALTSAVARAAQEGVLLASTRLVRVLA